MSPQILQRSLGKCESSIDKDTETDSDLTPRTLNLELLESKNGDF